MHASRSGRITKLFAGLSLAVSMCITFNARASAQQVFDACYVEKTGVLYLIDPTGTVPGTLPTTCIKPGKHIQFRWVDGEGADHGLLTGLGDDDHPQYLLVDGSRALTGDLIANGKVAIGTASATSSLTILPRNGADIEFASGTGNNADIYARNTFYLGTLSGHPVSLLTQGQLRLTVAGDGKVGIGTYQPTEQLTVTGVVQSTTGGFKFPDGTVQTSAAGTGAPSILADGVTSTTDGFAVTGNIGTGSIPATNQGVRLMWYAGKAAFRSGWTSSTSWEDANVGRFSVAQGQAPTASGEASTALGSYTRAAGYRSTALGSETKALGFHSTATGHQAEAVGNQATAIGFQSKASGDRSLAVGDRSESSGHSSVSMGGLTVASGDAAVAMGRLTQASGQFSTALGGSTVASGQGATALGGSTEASGRYSTALGSNTVALGNFSIAMGNQTAATGSFSTAMGSTASTNGYAGSFVYGDASTSTTVFATAQNQFMVRAAGGTTFYSDAALSAGVELLPGAGAWATVSDRNRKYLFEDVSGESVLERIAAMPIQSWSYRSQDPSIRHVGPTAQDFYAAFGLGQGDKTITTSDISGINMLAIQALEQRTRELAAANARLADLEERLAALEAILTSTGTATGGRQR